MVRGTLMAGCAERLRKAASERHAKNHLHLSWITRRGELAEQSVRLDAGRAESRRRIDRGELGVVQGVVCLNL